jgi:hypothetical protein
MPDLKTVIREYLAVADAMLLQEIRGGLISMEEAKQDTIETEKWREMLAILEATDILHGGRHARTDQ